MSSETPAATVDRRGSRTVRGGVVAGLAGGAAMGAMIWVMMTPVIERAIPALYGLDGVLAGWVAHLLHAAVLGVAFAGLVRAVPRYAEPPARTVGLGVAYGVVLWAVLAAVVTPVWLSAVGFPNAPPLPNFDPMSLVGHVVYGAVLGAVYPAVADF